MLIHGKPILPNPCQETGTAGLQVAWPGAMAMVERKPPPAPHRDDVVLHGTADATAHSKDFNRQLTELQVRIAVLNGYTAFDITVTKVAGWVFLGNLVHQQIVQ